MTEPANPAALAQAISTINAEVARAITVYAAAHRRLAEAFGRDLARVSREFERRRQER